MAITTIDGLLAGAQFPVHWHKHLGTETGEGQGILISPLYFIGTPGAAVVPSPGMAGAALTSYAGTLPFENPSSGNAYLMRQTASMSTTNTSMHFLCDRLWHNSGIDVTATGAQTINSVAWPARDRNGSTDGAEVMVGIEVSTETANGGAVTNTTLDYTNSDGTSGRTGTIVQFPATARKGTFMPFRLAAGDVGIRSIQGITLGTSYISGEIHLVAYRILNICSPPGATGYGGLTDPYDIGFTRCYDNTVLWPLIFPSAALAAGTNFWGSYTFTHG